MKKQKLPAGQHKIKFYPKKDDFYIIDERKLFQTKQHIVRELNYKPIYFS